MKKIKVAFDDEIIVVDQTSTMNGCLDEVILACADRIKNNKNYNVKHIEFSDKTRLYQHNIGLFQNKF